MALLKSFFSPKYNSFHKRPEALSLFRRMRRYQSAWACNTTNKYKWRDKKKMNRRGCVKRKFHAVSLISKRTTEMDTKGVGCIDVKIVGKRARARARERE
jgi:hypothetical protein